jgi:hypothetical protein
MGLAEGNFPRNDLMLAANELQDTVLPIDKLSKGGHLIFPNRCFIIWPSSERATHGRNFIPKKNL